jgi:DnaK suppressor protein
MRIDPNQEIQRRLRHHLRSERVDMFSARLSDAQIRDLQQLLEEHHAQLLRKVDQSLHAENRGELSISSPSDDDWALADQSADAQIATVERDTQELQRVEAALQSIQAGRYGQCIACNAMIDYARLLAHPTARRCLTCQELLESEAKHNRR